MIPPLNDELTTADLLDRKDFVERLAKIVTECQPPQVIGLHGDWGSGKSSVLAALKENLIGKEFHVVWFAAWRFQSEKSPILALLHEIRKHFPAAGWLTGKLKKFSSVAARALLDHPAISALMGGLKAGDIEKHGQRYEEDAFETLLPAESVQDLLNYAVQTLVGEEKRLVILVDDLDRCEPECAYQLLNGIKIFFSIPSCVFVLGMNRDVVSAALQQLYKTENEKRRAAEYLEKIAPYVLEVPAVRKPHDMLVKLHGTIDLKIGSLPNIKALAQVLESSDCLPRNPRRIKAFLNVLLRYHGHKQMEPRIQLGSPDNPQRADRLMVLMASLYLFHNDVYRMLEVKPAFIEALFQWAGQEANPSAPAEQTSYKVLALLEKSHVPEKVQGTPETTIYRDLYRDPGSTSVFRLQNLLQALGSVTKTEISDYLIEG